ncbi:MAG TPA: redoxin domain-containing protein [Candidatus Acidoferrales bacterium]|nr:redoxin domain-containing protein [Candidatus Acidoferrales bacterium]
MMAKKRVLWIGVMLVALAGCRSKSPAHSRARPGAPAGEIGSRLPEFSVKGLRGRRISTADFRGKVVLVDFWATWCQPCEKEMPGYQKLAQTYGPRGFAVVGFKSGMMMDTEDPLHFAARVGVRYPLAVATDALVGKFGGLKGLPTTLIYDRQGILRTKIIGFEYASTFERDVKRLL